MAISSSSIDSIPESREPTPEWDPTAAYEALAPLHWDAEEFDFGVVSEEDEPKTEGEDLQLLFQEESESSDEEDPSSDGVDSSSEEEIDSPLRRRRVDGRQALSIPRVLRGGQRRREQRRRRRLERLRV